MCSLEKYLLSYSFNCVVWLLLLLSYMSYLYILEIKPLSLTSFASILSQSIDSFFVSFTVQKLLTLIMSFIYFWFYFHFLSRLT